MYIYINICIYVYIYIYLNIYTWPSKHRGWLARHDAGGGGRESVAGVGLYQVFFHSEAFVHESIILWSLPPPCIARTIAVLVHVYCAIYDPPPTPLVYAIHHTISVMTISCKGQGGRGREGGGGGAVLRGALFWFRMYTVCGCVCVCGVYVCLGRCTSFCCREAKPRRASALVRVHPISILIFLYDISYTLYAIYTISLCTLYICALYL